VFNIYEEKIELVFKLEEKMNTIHNELDEINANKNRKDSDFKIRFRNSVYEI